MLPEFRSCGCWFLSVHMSRTCLFSLTGKREFIICHVSLWNSPGLWLWPLFPHNSGPSWVTAVLRNWTWGSLLSKKWGETARARAREGETSQKDPAPFLLPWVVFFPRPTESVPEQKHFLRSDQHLCPPSWTNFGRCWPETGVLFSLREWHPCSSCRNQHVSPAFLLSTHHPQCPGDVDYDAFCVLLSILVLPRGLRLPPLRSNTCPVEEWSVMPERQHIWEKIWEPIRGCFQEPTWWRIIYFKGHFNYMCMGVLLHVCLCATCVQCPQRPEEGVRSSETGGTEGWELASMLVLGRNCS